MVRIYPTIFPPEYGCTANITTNADIGGNGVMSAFLVTAWFTILVAAVPAFYDFGQWFRKRRKNASSNSTAIEDGLPQTEGLSDHIKQPKNPKCDPKCRRRHRLVENFESLLGPLCDLQAITSVSIVIAALAMHNTISFYHEQLALCYWYISLNSFWAARAEFMDLGPELPDDSGEDPLGDEDKSKTRPEFGDLDTGLSTNSDEDSVGDGNNSKTSSDENIPKTSPDNNIPKTSPDDNNSKSSPDEKDKNKDLRVIVRRLSILASGILGLSFQIWVNMREWREGAWDNGQSNRCFNNRDGTSTWPWVVGLLLFCSTLFLTFFETTRIRLLKFFKAMKKVRESFLDTILPSAYKSLKAEWSGASTSVSSKRSTGPFIRRCRQAILVVWRLFVLIFSAFAFALFWLSQVWLSVWAYGDTEYRITWWVYLGFCIWNSFDIISLRRMNRHLLGDEEFQWGFGQVLPLVMLLAPLYNSLDTFLNNETDEDKP